MQLFHVVDRQFQHPWCPMLCNNNVRAWLTIKCIYIFFFCHMTPLHILNTNCAERKAWWFFFKKKKLHPAPHWPLLGGCAPSTHIQIKRNTEGAELKSCVQSSGTTAGTVRWHLYYVPWGVLEDFTSICFPSLPPLPSYRNQATSHVWQERTQFRGTT